MTLEKQMKEVQKEQKVLKELARNAAPGEPIPGPSVEYSSSAAGSSAIYRKLDIAALVWLFLVSILAAKMPFFRIF